LSAGLHTNIQLGFQTDGFKDISRIMDQLVFLGQIWILLRSRTLSLFKGMDSVLDLDLAFLRIGSCCVLSDTNIHRD
jgi:hypothetical protein